jgi:prepilin-type N-terminal cleavage/methylation domain-containing protein
MSASGRRARQFGFTLIELMVALGIFLLVTGAAFGLLKSSQERYQTESQVLTSFQEARLALDQIVRDVNDSGYPPPTYIVSSDPTLSASSPFAWSLSAGYPNSACQIATGGSGNCTTTIAGNTSPGDFDLIIETTPNRLDPTCPTAPAPCQVQWIRYQLQGTTLYRGTAPKGPTGSDPDGTTSTQLVPFVQNVINNSSSAQITQYQLAYPTMFPANAPVAIFSYNCDTGGVATPCSAATGYNSPANIRDVVVTLIVSSPTPDAKTGLPRIVQLNGRGRRVNPNQ